MTERSLRFAIERPVEYRFTDTRGGAKLSGRTVNISSTGVLLRTEEKVAVGRKLELIVRMARLAPDGPEVDLLLLGMSVRSGEGWVAVQARKHQILRPDPRMAGLQPASGFSPVQGV